MKAKTKAEVGSSLENTGALGRGWSPDPSSLLSPSSSPQRCHLRPGDRSALGTEPPWGQICPGDRTSLGTELPWDRSALGTETPWDRSALGQNHPGDRTSLGTDLPWEQQELSPHVSRPALADQTGKEEPTVRTRPASNHEETPPASGRRVPRPSMRC